MQDRLYSEGYGVWYYPLKWVKENGVYSAPIQANDQQLEDTYNCYWSLIIFCSIIVSSLSTTTLFYL
jgi:hypothetical protein